MKPLEGLTSSNQLSRRTFLRLTGVGAGGLLLTACMPAPAGQPVGDTGGGEAAATSEKIEVSFWTPGGSQIYCDGFATIAKNFEELTPNINIGDTQCGVGDQNFNEVLLARVAAGDPPDATIIWTSPSAFGARNALFELDQLMEGSQYSQKEAWPAGVLASCIWKGKTYGLPVAAGNYAVFYNEEMFEAAGLSSKREDFPKTWDEMREISKAFTKWNGDQLDSIGFLPWDNDQYTLPIWSALNGSQIYDSENQQYTINNDDNTALMEYGLAWLAEEYQGDRIKLGELGNWGGYPDNQGRPGAFTEGKMAMHVSGFWFCGDMYNSELKFERWNVAPFPVGPSGTQTASGYWPNWLVIPKGSRHPEEAFKYLDYMSGEGIKEWFANIPDMPTNKNVSTDLYPTLVAEKRGEAFAQEVTSYFRSLLDVATPMWNSPIQDFANDQLARALDQIYSKSATIEAALTETQDACQAELDNLLKSNA